MHIQGFCILIASMKHLSSILLVIAVCHPAWSQSIDFNRQVKPVLSDRCFPCHGPDANQRATEWRLDELTEMEHVLSPGQPDSSLLIQRMESPDEAEKMPPPDSNLTLSDDEIKILRQWILDGAQSDQHWSFVPIVGPPVPEPQDARAAQNEIDRFVLSQLEQRKLRFAPTSTREALLRRVTFDLTGVSPTLQELDHFLADESPDAFERVVDRLLASPRYGERMASFWLDLARYSDTYGFQVDGDRMVWPWRDWVVRSFNANLPFDQFVIQQIAGDLLPHPTDDQILATTFSRLHPQNVEGGSIEEEFRVEHVADRIHTVGTAFLGLTVECARCHDHKFDPFSMDDYYSFFAFFNNIDEAGLHSYFDHATPPPPTLALMDEAKKTELENLKSAVAEAERALNDRLQNLTSDPSWKDWLLHPEKRKKLADQSGAGLVKRVDFSSIGISGNQRIENADSAEIQFNGDDEIRIGAGKFDRHQPFSILTRIKIPAQPAGTSIDRNVIYHCSRAWTDSASRGYQLLIEDGKLSFSIIHFWPGNAVCVQTSEATPTDQWLDVGVTYDGSSSASGIRIFVDGKRQSLDIVRDGLTRTILGNGTNEIILGARFRDKGFKDGQMSKLNVYDRELTPIEVAQGSDQSILETLLSKQPDPLDAHELASLRDYYIAHACPEAADLRDTLRQRRTALAKFQDEQTEIMVMRESVGLRKTYVLSRGAYDSPLHEVPSNTPSMLPPLTVPDHRSANRLDLANWMVSDENPLTARVAVNQFWQLLFGSGLVKTPEDFGTQSLPPTHLELLNWLAADFRKDWDVKRCLKQIVMSTTYQQSGRASRELAQSDPENEWLARGPQHRLTAEMLRDNVLFQSGLLVEELGGPPVRPYDLALAFSPVKPDSGKSLYRRSLYTYWKRTSTSPAMLVLDAPAREVCTVERDRTSSPIQGFVLLNGTQFVEAARKLSENMMIQHADNNELIIRDLFRSLTSRFPRPDEIKVLANLYQQQLEAFSKNEQAVEQLLSTGEAPSNLPQRAAELAAWTIVASTLINFEECLVRR